MAHARTVERPFPQTATSLIAAALAAVVLTALAAVATLDPFGSPGPTGRGVTFSPAVIASARQWEVQRQQQSGVIDWVGESARDWELQRRQQGALD